MLGERLDHLTLAYGTAHLGKILFWYASELLIAFYLTEACGLSGRAMGLVLAVSFIVGAAADIVAGRALRAYLLEPGNALTLQRTGAFLSALTLVGLFVTDAVDPALRLYYALVVAMAFRAAYVLMDLPQNVLLTTGTANDAARSRLAALRIFFSSAGALAVAALLGMLAMAAPALAGANRFIWTTCLLALCAIAGTSWLASAGAGQFAPGLAPGPVASSGTAMRQPLPRALWRNIGLGVTVTMLVSCFGKLAPYYAAYVLQGAPWGAYMVLASALGAAMSQPGWAYLARRYGGPSVLSSTAVLLGLAALALLVGARTAPIAGPAAFLLGASSGGMGMLLWAAFGNIVARERMHDVASAYATLTAMLKVGLGLSGMGLGFALSAIDYRGGDGNGLIQLMGMPPLIAALIILWAMQRPSWRVSAS